MTPDLQLKKNSKIITTVITLTFYQSPFFYYNYAFLRNNILTHILFFFITYIELLHKIKVP